MKKIKENLSKWKEILCSWIGKFNITKKTSFFPKLIYRFNTTPSKYQQNFGGNNKLIPTFIG